MTTAKTTSPLTPAADAAPVKIAAAKGRPMLSWVGKRPLGLVTAFPAQAVERFDPQHVLGTEQADAYANGGLLFHGDNKEVLAHLLASGFRGKVNLIYIDPPFDSGADYVRKVSLRGGGTAAKLEGETYTLGEQTQYTDIWANDNYLQFMYERLLILKELLAEGGSIALHCDAKRNYLLRMLLEEVFGAEGFRGEVIVRTGVKNVQAQFEEMSSLTQGNNTIHLFAKSPKTKYKKLQIISSDFEPGKWDTFWRGTDRKTMRYNLLGELPKYGQWRWEQERAELASANYATYLASTEANLSLDGYYIEHLNNGVDLDFLRRNPEGVVQYYVSPRKHKLLSNVWLDIPYRGTVTDYPTEKNEAIVERFVSWITNPNDLVLDCFIGSGTTAAVAQKLGRRWIGCDINKGAIQTASKRLQGIVTAQSTIQDAPPAKKGKAKAAQQKLDVDDTAGVEDTAAEVPTTAQPAQLAFSIWRVNDYDLQIQHNEAVQLACQHLGVTRTKGDSFFDGTRGQQLVKVVPFNHPLSPLDLEEVKTALENRPDETRSVLMVCLGVELAAQGWIEDWNRLRKVSDPNRIDYIELRTDPKYGKFFEHKPASAQVSVTREGETGRVKIENFVSPTILERLAQTAGVLSPKIDDWRAMADCVLIDTNYDGSVFSVVLSDVPEKKNDLVAGEYSLTLPQTPTTVGVKIIDMLGEEVLETVQV